MKWLLGFVGLVLSLGCCCCIPMPPPEQPRQEEPPPNDGGVLQTTQTPDDSGVIHFWGNCYPGIQVYHFNQERNTITPIFKVVRVLANRRLLVQNNSGNPEELLRDDYQGDEFVVQKADVVALGGVRTW